MAIANFGNRFNAKPPATDVVGDCAIKRPPDVCRVALEVDGDYSHGTSTISEGGLATDDAADPSEKTPRTQPQALALLGLTAMPPLAASKALPVGTPLGQADSKALPVGNMQTDTLDSHRPPLPDAFRYGLERSKQKQSTPTRNQSIELSSSHTPFIFSTHIAEAMLLESDNHVATSPVIIAGEKRTTTPNPKKTPKMDGKEE